MISIFIFILILFGFAEMLCISNMSAGYYTSGFAAYKETFKCAFDKSHALRTKKLKERLDNNLDWINYHYIELRRLSSNELIFAEREHQFLARSGPQLLMGHIVLNPDKDEFTITGRVRKTVYLVVPMIAYIFAEKGANTVEASIIFAIVVIAILLFGKMMINRYYKPRYEEVASAIADVINEPNKSFKVAPYRSRDLTNRSAP